MDDLVAWVTERCEVEKVRKQWTSLSVAMSLQASGDRILCTTAPLAKGRKLTLPPSCVLSADVVKASPSTRFLVEGAVAAGIKAADFDRYTLFAAFLLYEDRRPRDTSPSPWAPYLGCLPRDIATHPITYLPLPREGGDEGEVKAGDVGAEGGQYAGGAASPEEAALQEELAKEEHAVLRKALGAQRAKFLEQWELLQRVLKCHGSPADSGASSLLASASSASSASSSSSASPGVVLAPSRVSYADFVWANCMVISRAFNIEAPLPMMCMLPFVDSMNHRGDGTQTVLWKPKLVRGHFIMSLLRPLEAGEELTAQYHKEKEAYVQVDCDPRKGEGKGAERAARSARTVAFEEMRNFLMYGFVGTDRYDRVMELAAARPGLDSWRA